MERIRQLGYDIIEKSEKELYFSEELRDTEVLVCYNPFNTLDISKLPNLKWIQLTSVGIDQVPIDILKKNSITLTNNKGGYSIPIGEWIVLKLLEMYKNSKAFYQKQSQKIWKIDTSLLELYGKTIGFIGTGSIASEAAKRLKGFGVDILGLNTRGTKTEYFDKCYSIDKINEMVKLSDAIVVSIPHTEKTHNLLNEEVFQEMKNGVYLVNIARGSIIDERAMINNLKNGKIKCAALDVFEKEPLDKNNPLWEIENVIITPHNSWVSEMRDDRRFNIIYDNLKRYLSNQTLKNIVDLNKGY
ncbi:Phosphoglycerate dehydrogenase [Proteiniborus ethanoligenes]|uniref:Phosphoglycerate dehydrogenase n=2 Tax=Proteiniborus ethanoligenes TaxID=415015 RepID=A0A1H3S5Y0_9FIRM|nr:Phosphoglycerate dehydrogenase [Proteiniborus ethanoligenes]